MSKVAFTDEEIQEFRGEAEELMDAAEKSLLSLDKGEEFNSNYDQVFRAFHSIKGAAGMMGLDKLQAHFHRLENTLTENKAGGKLSRNIVELFLKGIDSAKKLLNGEEVEPNYEIGSAPSPQKLAASAPARAEPQSLGRVIVVDDEIELAESISSFLTRKGIEVIATSDPEAVLSMIEKHKPDAIVSDILMPRLNGVELLKQISEHHPDLPAIFLSGRITEDALIEAIEHGVFGVLEKPFSPVRLYEYCMSAIEKHRASQILNHSINLILYQYSDLVEFLKSQGKSEIQKEIEFHINRILESKRALKMLRLNKNRRTKDV